MPAKTVLLLMIVAVSLSAQVTVEDFAGCNVTGATPGNPTVVTCANPHGFNNSPASGFVELGTMADGNTLSIGSQTWTFKSTISNGTPNRCTM